MSYKNACVSKLKPKPKPKPYTTDQGPKGSRGLKPSDIARKTWLMYGSQV